MMDTHYSCTKLIFKHILSKKKKQNIYRNLFFKRFFFEKVCLFNGSCACWGNDAPYCFKFYFVNLKRNLFQQV